MIAKCLCWKDFWRFTTQQQDYFLMSHTKSHFTPSHLCTGCPLRHAWNANSQLSVAFFVGLSSIYLSDLLSVYTRKRNLHSSSDNWILCINKLRTNTFQHRSFSFAAPTIWNYLPSELWHTDSIQKLKSALKTHPFRKFYTWCIIFLLTSIWTIKFDPLVPVWDCVTVKVWLVRFVVVGFAVIH